MQADINMLAAWAGFLCGALSGIIPGLLFQNAGWMGGYASWPRRLTRLGHISFFGIGLLNLGFSLTLAALGRQHELPLPAVLFLVGAVSMPAVCYLSAWRPAFRHLFFIPVVSLLAATALTLAGIWPS